MRPSSSSSSSWEKRPMAETGDSSGGNSSGGAKFKGVRMRKWGKWVAEVRLPNSRERIWLGSYDTPEKAARAYDAAVFCLRGSGVTFNFPDNPPHIPDTENLTPAQIQAAAARFAHQDPAPVSSETISSTEFQMDDGANTEKTRWPPMTTSVSGRETSATEFFGSEDFIGASPLEYYFTRDEAEEEHPCDGGASCQQPGLWSF